MSNPIERVSPNDRRLPPNLLLPEPVDAEILPDGRAVPLTLPPGAKAFHYPDLEREAGVLMPSFAEATETEEVAADTPLTSAAPTPDGGQNTGQTPTSEAVTTPDAMPAADETESVTSDETHEATAESGVAPD